MAGKGVQEVYVRWRIDLFQCRVKSYERSQTDRFLYLVLLPNILLCIDSPTIVLTQVAYLNCSKGPTQMNESAEKR